MIRILLAAALLRMTGSPVEYRVQRNRKDKSTKDGTTYLRTASYKAAKTKFQKMRTAYTDTVNIRLVAVVNTRDGITPAEKENKDA